MGMVPLIGYNYAARNIKRMKSIHRTAQASGLVVSVLCIILYEIFAGNIMSLFIDNAETVRLGTSYIRVRCLATFMMFACFNFVFFFQAVGMGKYSLVLAVVRQLVFNIPLLCVLDSLFGMTGVIWTQFTADTITALVSVALYRKVGKNTWDKALA